MDPGELDGRKLALVLHAVDQNGEPDWALFGGIARFNNDILHLDRGKGNPPFEIRAEWYERIKPVND